MRTEPVLHQYRVTPTASDYAFMRREIPRLQAVIAARPWYEKLRYALGANDILRTQIAVYEGELEVEHLVKRGER